jgi:two-component system phosphate regulon sensor histidine kinase PhoR
MRGVLPPSGVPRRLLAVFGFLVLIPAAAVVGLGVTWIRQDRVREQLHLRAQLGEIATRVADGLRARLDASERQFDEGQVPGDDGTVLIVRDDGIETRPHRPLLYQPIVPNDYAPPSSTEVSEASGDLHAAEGAYRREAMRSDPPARARALVQLARVLRHQKQYEHARETYDELARLGDVAVDGVPAGLVAARAKCLVFEVIDGRPRLQHEAAAIRAGLLQGTWRIDGGTFEQYLREVERWTGMPVTPPPALQALTLAADILWQHRGSSDRQGLSVSGQDLVLLWKTINGETIGILAGPRFQERHWLAPARAAVIAPDTSISFTPASAAPPDGRSVGEESGVTRLQGSRTRLPWDIRVSSSSAVAGEHRRRLLTAGLAVLVMLVVVGGYVVARTVSRELAIARLQADFVASVSHEFRTPLTSLRQFTDLLNEPDDPPIDKRRRFYAAQARATDRLQRLVESLLDFRRMESGAHRYQRTRVSAAALLEEVIAQFRADAGARGFTLESTVDGSDPFIDADGEALSLALFNLLDNALKYSGEHRLIHVSLSSRDGRVEIAVRDQGFGIARHEHRDIFRKFVRGNDPRVRTIKGTGLGLAMVQHIVNGHGGRIRVESVPGSGSTFTIDLPAAA